MRMALRGWKASHVGERRDAVRLQAAQKFFKCQRAVTDSVDF
jgi:hypothetical protein